jgi:ATP-dependent DNA helicase RecQ
LLCGREDADILLWFIETAFPTPDQVDAVLAAFARTGGSLSLQKLTEMVDIKRGQLELMLKQLDVEGVLRRVGGQTFERTEQAWTYPTERVEGVTGARRNEQQLMFDYMSTERCRMQFLTSQLDDPAIAPCGVCDNCTGVAVDPAVDPELVRAADAYLRRRPLHIEPKKQGIKTSERHEVGRVLCRWGDPGWAPLVERGIESGWFDDELVGAVFQMLAEWRPDPDPEWVTSVPSARGDLVADFAARLADEIGLPYVDTVIRIDERPPQKSLQNSHHQKANVQGVFSVIRKPPPGPGLLIDDLYDSGWTLTEVATSLRRAGAGQLHPVCLASTTGRST